MTPPSDPSPPVVPLAVDVAADLEARLRRLGEVPVERAVSARHLAALDLDRAARRRRRRAAVVGVVGGAVLLGSTSLAAAGVLPAPAQSAAHDTLGRLGIDVPSTPVGVSSPQGDPPGRGGRAADRVDGRGLGGAAGAETRRRLGAAPVGRDGGGEAATRALGADRARGPRSDTMRPDGQASAGRSSDARARGTRSAGIPARVDGTGRDGTGAAAKGSGGGRPPSGASSPPVAASGPGAPSASSATRPAAGAGAGDDPTVPRAAGRPAGAGDPPSAPVPSPGVRVPGSGVAAPRDGANP